jgi:hypothetical protein
MIRTLFIIAGAALVLCIVTAGGAVAIGGQDLQRHGWAWTFRDEDGDAVRFERVASADEPDVSRTLAWTGGQRLVNTTPFDVEYRQGPTASVVVTGPQAWNDRVQLADGVLRLADGPVNEEAVIRWSGHNITGRSFDEAVRIVVTAPNIAAFEVQGSGDLDIQGYDQPALSVAVSGSADVMAQGRTEALDVAINGSGDAALTDLTTQTARVVVSGSGDVSVSPRGEANVTINGSGDVSLGSRPTRLISELNGSGEIIQD